MPGQRTVCSGKSGISIDRASRFGAIGGPTGRCVESSPPRAPGVRCRSIRAGARSGRARPRRGPGRPRSSPLVCVEDLVAALAAGLGLVHRDVGVAQQVVDGADPRRDDRDADARADLDGDAGHLDRLDQPCQQPLRDGHRVGLVREVGAAGRRTRHRPAGRRRPRPAGRSGGARRPRSACSSPAAWPRLSLTVLKSSRSRNRAATEPVPTLAVERLLGGLDEPAAVGQPGQRVVERLVAQLRLESAALGHVAGEHPDQAGQAGQDEQRQDRGARRRRPRGRRRCPGRA